MLLRCGRVNSYSTSTPHNILQGLRKRHWLLVTPLLIAFIVDETWRKRMINAFLSVMIITLILSFFQSAFHLHLFRFATLRDHLHCGSVFVNHIIQSFAMNIAAFICLYRALFEKKWRWFYIILFIGMAVDILFLSLGRTGYGIFFILLCYTGLMRFGWRGIVSTAENSLESVCQ